MVPVTFNESLLDAPFPDGPDCSEIGAETIQVVSFLDVVQFNWFQQFIIYVVEKQFLFPGDMVFKK